MKFVKLSALIVIIPIAAFLLLFVIFPIGISYPGAYVYEEFRSGSCPDNNPPRCCVSERSRLASMAFRESVGRTLAQFRGGEYGCSPAYIYVLCDEATRAGAVEVDFPDGVESCQFGEQVPQTHQGLEVGKFINFETTVNEYGHDCGGGDRCHSLLRLALPQEHRSASLVEIRLDSMSELSCVELPLGVDDIVRVRGRVDTIVPDFAVVLSCDDPETNVSLVERAPQAGAKQPDDGWRHTELSSYGVAFDHPVEWGDTEPYRTSRLLRFTRATEIELFLTSEVDVREDQRQGGTLGGITVGELIVEKGERDVVNQETWERDRTLLQTREDGADCTDIIRSASGNPGKDFPGESCVVIRVGGIKAMEKWDAVHFGVVGSTKSFCHLRKTVTFYPRSSTRIDIMGGLISSGSTCSSEEDLAPYRSGEMDASSFKLADFDRFVKSLTILP